MEEGKRSVANFCLTPSVTHLENIQTYSKKWKTNLNISRPIGVLDKVG